jgi:hypothetical protein
MVVCLLDRRLRLQEVLVLVLVVQTLIHTFQAILLHVETTFRHLMAGETPVITLFLEIDLRKMEETETGGLVARVLIVNVGKLGKGSKTGSVSYIVAEACPLYD